MISRFEGEAGKENLIQALLSQTPINGDKELAAEIASIVTLKQLSPDEEIIQQNNSDNDMYFIVTGTTSIIVNGRTVAERKTGTHVGEIAAMDPTAKRTATVKAKELTVVAKISSPEFCKIADKYPGIWRKAAIEVASRLQERSKFLRLPNLKPMLFIGSSKEAEGIAKQLGDMICSPKDEQEEVRETPDLTAEDLLADDCEIKIWNDGFFELSATAIESLTALLENYDFGIIILTADDVVEFRGITQPAPRDNAVFELGLLIGGIGRFRTFIVRQRGAELKIPSDLYGVTCLEFDGADNEKLVKSIGDAAIEIKTKIRGMGPK